MASHAGGEPLTRPLDVLRRWWWAALVLVTVTAYQVVPSSPGSRLPVASVGEADPPFTLWTLRSAAANIVHRPSNLLYGNVFWPRRDALAFSDAQLGYAPFYGVLSLLTRGQHVLAYNVLLFGGFVLGPVVVLKIARVFGASPGGALLAAVVFASLPYRSAEVTHIQLTASWLLLAALLALVQWLVLRRRRWALAFGLLAGATWNVSGYLAVVLAWAAGLVVVVWAMRPARRAPIDRRWWEGSGVAVVGALLLAAPTLPAYVRVQRGGWLARPLDQVIRVRSAQLPPSTFYRLLGRPVASPAGPDALLPGMVVLALVVVCLATSMLAVRRSRSDRVGDGARRSSVAELAAPVAIASTVLALLAIGSGHGVLSRPFELARSVPGMRSVREPARFAIVVFAFASVWIGLFVDRALRALPRRAPGFVLAGLIAVVPAEVLYRPRTMSLSSITLRDDIASVLRRLPPGAVLEEPMPTDTVQLDAITSLRQLRGLDDGQPRVLGFSGGLPPEVPPVFEAGRAFPSPASLVRLRDRSVRYIILWGSGSATPCTDGYTPAELDAIVGGLRRSVSVSRVVRVGSSAIVVLASDDLRPAELAIRFDQLPSEVRLGARCR